MHPAFEVSPDAAVECDSAPRAPTRTHSLHVANITASGVVAAASSWRASCGAPYRAMRLAAELLKARLHRRADARRAQGRRRDNIRDFQVQ